MKNRTSVLVILVILSFLLVLSSANAQLLSKIIKSEGGGGTDVVELISNIPSDAQILVSVNWENLAQTDLLDMGKQMLGEDIAIIEEMGIDIVKDVQHVVMGVTFEEEPDVYVVVAGTFDSAKILELIEEEGAEIEKLSIGGKTVYGLEGLFVNFNKTGLFFAVSDAEDETAITKMITAGEKNLANNAEMVNLVKDVDTAATAWAAVIIPDELREEMAEDADEVPFDPNTLRMANMSLNYGEEIVLKTGIHFSDADEAGNLVTFLKDQISAMKENPDLPPEITSMMEALKLSADGKVARATFTMEADKVQEILGQVMGMMMGGMADDEWEDDEEEWEEEDEEEGWDDDEEDDEDLEDEEEDEEVEGLE